MKKLRRTANRVDSDLTKLKSIGTTVLNVYNY